METLKINTCGIKNNRITVDYSISSGLEKYFNKDESFFVEYDDDVSNISEGIAVIPFLTNVLPIVWLTNSTLYAHEIDKSFFDSISAFKQGYIDMYPNAKFLGELVVDRLTEHQCSNYNKYATFFTGGVDSFSTLISNLSKRPDLILIWGADITFDDIGGWGYAKHLVEKIANQFALSPIFLKSSFRRFINEYALQSDFKPILGDGWWHGIQHGIGLIGHSAPIAITKGINTIFIPATLTESNEKVTCASYPTIDNCLKFSSCNIVHEGFQYSRQDKIYNICNFRRSGNQVNLRVCWEAKGGGNCCNCEKCYRTIMGIISEKENPKNYGFIYSISKIKTYLCTNNFPNYIVKNWVEIQEGFLSNRDYWLRNKQIKWFLTFDFMKPRTKKAQFKYKLQEITKRLMVKLTPSCILKIIINLKHKF